VTDVTTKTKWAVIALFVLSSLALAQAKPSPSGAAESLYLRLGSVGLDSKRVFRVRQASLDRGSIHISLDDGTIAFTEEVDGHVTGAIFVGDGELLLIPPNSVERNSVAFFTGAAILEERFSFAYFRFNDDLLAELKTSLRAADQPGDFVELWNHSATSLARQDALRLLISFTNGSEYDPSKAGDHLLHAYIGGARLGTFEVRYDSLLPEPVFVGGHKVVEGNDYYDVWASFAEKKVQQEETDPDVGLLGTHDFSVTQFTISTDVKPPTEISATAVLSLTPRRSGSRVLLFELSRLLQVQSVEADGSRVEFIHNQAVEGSQLARRGNDALAVLLPSPMKAGVPIRMKIGYSGSVLSEAANGLLYVGEHGTWYPNADFSMSSFDLEFRYPVGWTLVAVGRRTELKSEGGQQTARWVTERKVPVAGFNLGKYSRTVTRAAGVNVETYATSTVEKGFVAAQNSISIPVTPKSFDLHPQVMDVPSGPEIPSPSRNAQLVSTTAGQALDFYAKHFGPYPYSALMLTQFPGHISQGWPGLIFLSSYAFLNSEELNRLDSDATGRLRTELVTPHETAHQWWGDLVTWNGYRDQWLMEALANYSALMLLETKDPAGFRKLLQRYRNDLLVKSNGGDVLMDAGPVTLGTRLSSSKFPNAYDAISYGRGTWMFHMLRMMMRDYEPASQRSRKVEEPFIRALHTLRTDYEGRSVSTAQVLSVFEAQLPKPLWYEGQRSLAWFHESWLNGTAVPHFEVRDVKLNARGTTTLVTGTVVQDDAPDSLVTPVPLYAVVSGKPVFLQRVFAEGHETTFRISAPAGTRKILVDPEQTLLSRSK